MSFSCYHFFFLVTFFERVRTVFFSVLTFVLPGGLVQMKRLLMWLLAWVVLSARCHREFSDLNVRFLENMDLESKQQFPPSYYKWVLILIPFYPYMFVLPWSFDLLSRPATARLRHDFLDLYDSIKLKHDFHLCTDQKHDHRNLNSWLDIMIKGFIGRSRTWFWVTIFNLSGFLP